MSAKRDDGGRIATERLGDPITVGEWTIVVLERVTLEHRRIGATEFFYGRLEPVAVLVSGRGREWRIEVTADAEPADVSDLTRTRSTP